MGLFGKKKEKSCCSGCSCESMKAAETAKNSGASVKVLGSGCAKCKQLEENTVEALKILGRDTTVDHVTDFAQIAAYGVMTTPALVVDSKVISYGKVLTAQEIVTLLS